MNWRYSFVQMLHHVDRLVGHLGAAGLREADQRVRADVVGDLLHQFHECIEVPRCRLDLALHRRVDLEVVVYSNKCKVTLAVLQSNRSVK